MLIEDFQSSFGNSIQILSLVTVIRLVLIIYCITAEKTLCLNANESLYSTEV